MALRISIDVRRWHREGWLRVGQRFSHSLTWLGEPTEGMGVLAEADAVPQLTPVQDRAFQLLDLGVKV